MTETATAPPDATARGEPGAGASPAGRPAPRRACRGLSHIFFPPEPEEWYTDPDPPESLVVAVERSSEQEAKLVCGGCGHAEACLTESLAEAEPGHGRFGHQPGVRAGFNRWERLWLTHATPQQLEQIRQTSDKLGQQKAISLREWFEHVGPPAESLIGRTAAEIAIGNGVPRTVARQWLDDAGLTGRNQRRGAPLKALESLLSDGDWLPRSLCADLLIEACWADLEDKDPDLAAEFKEAEARAEDPDWAAGFRDDDTEIVGSSLKRDSRHPVRVVQTLLRERKRWGQVASATVGGEEWLRWLPGGHDGDDREPS